MRPQETKLTSPLPGSSTKYILIGEDDMDDEELLREIITSVDNSFSIFFINNGQQVLTYLQGLKDNFPCLILLDYNMPILNGAEILETLKQDQSYASVPKIIWSTSTSEAFRKICLNAGANEYIVKPSSINELTEAIRHMLSFCSLV